MSKALLVLACVSISLLSALQLARRENVSLLSAQPRQQDHRRLSYGLQGWKHFDPAANTNNPTIVANDPRTTTTKNGGFANFQQAIGATNNVNNNLQFQGQAATASNIRGGAAIVPAATNVQFQQSTIVNFEDDNNMFNTADTLNINNNNNNNNNPQNNKVGNNLRDANIVAMNDDAASNPEPLQVCGRKAPISHELVLQLNQEYERCPLLSRPPEKTSILLIRGRETFGRTGNNLIEFLHSLQYGKDNNVLVVVASGSWPIRLITNMWMSVRANTDADRAVWRDTIERTFCVKILEDSSEAERYEEVIEMDTRDLFIYRHAGLLNQYVQFQGQIIRSLWRAYNDGSGFNIRMKQVKSMCSVLDAMFHGEEKNEIEASGGGAVKYSVIHSRSLEGEPGLRLLGRIARNVGCDPVAALDMKPEYVKAILEPLGMLEHPIIFLTDHQRPEVLKKLQADPDIGPNLRLVPEEASWVGGDVTVAVMADVFIGNPASTFSGFIAKSRVALGYDTNFLFRKQNKTTGEWVDVCDERCVFDDKVMWAMA